MKHTWFTAITTLALASQLLASPAPREGYVAHEWGTFTSVQAADGKQTEWNPLTVAELPKFVYDLMDSNGKDHRETLRFLRAKTAFRTLQRMETPVIYFYADMPQAVDVTVNFPPGVVTEWYPQVKPLPKPKPNAVMPLRRELQWEHVQILPPADATELPGDTSGSHYYAARETDANRVRVTTPNGGQETEKFLFCRGVGNFRAPLTVTMSDDGRELTVRNDGTDELRHAFVYQLRDGQGSFQLVKSLAAGKSKTLRLPRADQQEPLGKLRERLAQSLRSALVQEGLYEREAAAMVKTWDDSWLTEPGVRVLYTLSRAWTDRTLPLQLSPAPREVARVMVGRAEVITPQMELSLFRETQRYVGGDEAARTQALANVRRLGLGRFLQPAMTRLITNGPKSRDFSTRSWELLEAASKPEGSKTVAVK